MAETERKFIGEHLISRGIINQEQLNEALAEQRKTNGQLGSVLVRLGYAGEKDIATAISEQLGFAFVDLANYRIDPQVLKIIPEETARKLHAMPLFKIGDALTVAMTNPLDVHTVDELRRASGHRIRPVLGTLADITRTIEKYYGRREAKKEDESGEKEEINAALIREASKRTVIDLVDQIVREAVRQGASDIHLEPEEDKFFCRERIDGVLYDVAEYPKEHQEAVISRIKIMAEMDIAEKRLPQDGRIQMKIEEKKVDLRISTFPTLFGENVVIRILDKSKGARKLEELGFSPPDLKKISTLIQQPYGMILVTGPTGSGKTTTLYAILNNINTIEKNIITLEDPVEYQLDRVRQSQINPKAGLTFAGGLRSIVRQDPDIIMIGEIRDKETADIAIHSALTGHLIFSTLHTNNAAGAATRLVDMGIEPFLTSSALAGIVAQRLVRRLCGKCRKPYRPGRGLLEELGLAPGKDYTFYQEKGCRACRRSGYQGRIGIFELLLPNEKIKQLIVRRESAAEIESAAHDEGMKTLKEDGLEKVIQGITTVTEMLRVTKER